MVMERLALGFGVQSNDHQPNTAVSCPLKTVRFENTGEDGTFARDDCMEVTFADTDEQNASFAKFVETRNVVRDNAIKTIQQKYNDEKTFISNMKETSENRQCKLKRNHHCFTCIIEEEVSAQEVDSKNDKQVYELAVKKREDMYNAYMECKMAEHLERYEFRKKLKEKYSNDPALLASFHAHMADKAGFKKFWERSPLVRGRYEQMHHHSIGSRDKHGNMFYGEGEFPEVPADEDRWERMPTWWDDV